MEFKIKSAMLRFDKYLHATEKAYLLRIGYSEHWLPKKLCRNFILNKKLGGNVTVPAFLYERITGSPPEISDAETIIHHHTPAPLNPVTEVESLKQLSK